MHIRDADELILGKQTFYRSIVFLLRPSASTATRNSLTASLKNDPGSPGFFVTSFPGLSGPFQRTATRSRVSQLTTNSMFCYE